MQNYVGKQIDRYRITERLGMGGMAVVYKAFDTRLEREVALKLIRTDAIPAEHHERLLRRFEREAKSQAKFDHKNIVHIYDYGKVDGSPYLVMAFIPGGTLKDQLHGPVNWQKAVRWIIPVAEALAYAHQRGVIHRDVKPANILFSEEGQPILTDFGIAKVLETDEVTLTGTGLGVGTPEYMAPEQWQGQPSPASDQYALGVVLYELITGYKPYSADTPAAVAILQVTEPLALPRSYVKDIPKSVEKVLLKALSQNPDDRYENIIEFSNALNRILTLLENDGLNDINYADEIETRDSLKEKPSPKSKVINAKNHEIINSGQKGDDNLSLRENHKRTNTQTTTSGVGKKKRLGLLVTLMFFLLVIFLIVITPALIPNLIETFSRNNQNEEQPTTQPVFNETNETIVTANENLMTVTLTPTMQMTSTSIPSNPTTEIIGNSVYFRSGPSVYHPVISNHLNIGEEVRILARDETGNWFLAQTSNGLEGWLFTEWININFIVDSVNIADFIPTPPPAPKPTEKPAEKPTTVNQPQPTKEPYP